MIEDDFTKVNIPYGVPVHHRLLLNCLGVWYIKWYGKKLLVTDKMEFVDSQFISYGCDESHNKNKLDTIRFVLRKDLEKVNK